MSPTRRASTRRSSELVRERHADTLFSEDGSTVDEQVAALLRRADRAASSGAHDRHRRVLHRRPAGGAADRAARVPPTTSRRRSSPTRTRSRSPQAGVPRGADRAPRRGLRGGRARRSPTARRERLGADVGVGVTGVAGPGRRQRGEARRARLAERRARRRRAGGARELTRSVNLPGGRADVRERATRSRCT